MKELLSLNINQLKSLMEDLGEKPYAAKQLDSWLGGGVPFAKMTNLSKSLREKLEQDYCEGYAEIKEKHESGDGTVKYLMQMAKGGLVECVVMRYNHGNTLCVSTQVGCRMGCVFCASGKDGLIRNLSSGEMRSQFIAAQQSGEISNVVLMGSGEPLDNYDNVISFIKALNENHGIGMRHISLSTCGLVPGILKLAKEDMQITLCISLHSAIDEKRKKLMPVAKAFTVKQIIDAARAYFEKTGRRIIIEYTLIKGLNDGTEDMKALEKELKGLNCHINIIPLNLTQGDLHAPAKKQAHVFAAELEKTGMSATVRRSLGGDIQGACGQLKVKYEKS